MINQDSYILINMYRIVKELDRETNRICNAHGLTMGQFMILEALYHKDGMTVGQIKDKVLGTDGNIPVVIANLAKAGLVSRVKAADDARKSLTYLTDEGKKVIEAVMPENTAMFESRFSVWTEEEKKQLAKLFRKYR